MPVVTRSQSRSKHKNTKATRAPRRTKQRKKSKSKRKTEYDEAPKRSKRIANKTTNSKNKKQTENLTPQKRKLSRKKVTPPKRNRPNTRAKKPKTPPDTPSKQLANLLNTTFNISTVYVSDDEEQKQGSHTKNRNKRNNLNRSIIDFNVSYFEEEQKKNETIPPSPSPAPTANQSSINVSLFNQTINQSINQSHIMTERTMKLKEMAEELLTREVTDLCGRQSEHDMAFSFLKKHLLRSQSGSFYICGSPGTGKSATMNKILRYFDKKSMKKKYNIDSMIFINGMSFTNPSQIYPFLYSKITGNNRSRNVSAMTAKTKLETLLFDNDDGMNIVVIDEMDGLLGGAQQQVLYHLFGWCKRPNCNLILFGIANSIDLTDRFLPRLKQRNFEPELLIFKPYTKNELFDILNYRLNAFKNEELFFDEIALRLCAQKVASIYGDVRKCLEICRKCLEYLMNDQSKQKIGFIEMKEILNLSFQSPMIGVIRDLPNHQKVIMVVSSLLANKSLQCGDGGVIYDKLEQFYNFIGNKYTLPKTSSTEFYDIIDSLISDNVIANISKNGNSRSKNGKGILRQTSKLQILVPFGEICYAFEEDQLLNKLLKSKVQIPRRFML